MGGGDRAVERDPVWEGDGDEGHRCCCLGVSNEDLDDVAGVAIGGECCEPAIKAARLVL